MSEDAQEMKNGIQVIARAAAVLRSLKGSSGGMSLAQIAEKVDLPRSTVQRIVRALQNERLVIAPGTGTGIRLGPELHALAESARYNTAEIVRPLLQDVSRETGETVDLSVLRGAHMVFIDQIPGTQRLRAISSVGEEFPLTTTANGKACLSLMQEEDVERLVRTEWARSAHKSDMTAFAKELAAVRASGVSFDRDQHTHGISAVGTGFSDWKGDLFAISIPTPTSRFRHSEDSLTRSILAVGAKVRELFGLSRVKS